MKKGKLIIISAPSGCGKSTIINEIIKNPDLKLEFSISATTREPRRGEKNGVNYYFMTVDEFKQANISFVDSVLHDFQIISVNTENVVHVIRNDFVCRNALRFDNNHA